MTDAAAPPEAQGPSTRFSKPSPAVPEKRRYDRSIVEGDLKSAVWKIAWPTMLTNVVGGLQGIIDHVLVGHFVGYTGNAAIGVAWQMVIVVIIFFRLNCFLDSGNAQAQQDAVGAGHVANKTAQRQWQLPNQGRRGDDLLVFGQLRLLIDVNHIEGEVALKMFLAKGL